MNVGASAGPSSRRRDTLVTKRVFAGLGCLGLLFVLWLLVTPVQQIYWATQARAFEAKPTVSSGDHLYPPFGSFSGILGNPDWAPWLIVLSFSCVCSYSAPNQGKLLQVTISAVRYKQETQTLNI